MAMARVAASIAAVALVTLLYSRVLPVNPTTAALSYLVAILLIATTWGIVPATSASVVAVLCFNFFFLPPVVTFTISDPQNWVAFVAFLMTAVVASQLSGRARQREIDAAARQRDLERLYALSRSLLLSDSGVPVASALARLIANTFELEAVALYDRRADTVASAGALELPGIDAALRDVARGAAPSVEPGGLAVMPIQLGGAPIGSLAVAGTPFSDTVLHSIANLAAIGLERARSLEITARAEAAQQSSDLRATVLDALAHEFKTPLTSMKVASSELLANGSRNAHDHELLEVLDEDVDRLGGLVTDAVQMLRIDSGDFAVHLERHNAGDLLASVIRAFARRLEGHEVVVDAPPDLTVDADRELIELALRQLVDNALKYSPPGSDLVIRACVTTTLDFEVHNSGSVIPERDRAHVVERFYRGGQARRIPGSGLGLAIVQQIALAHGGSLAVASATDSGTTVRLSLPRERPAS
jgi:two-component system sensor histidine kinase KdpD